MQFFLQAMEICPKRPGSQINISRTAPLPVDRDAWIARAVAASAESVVVLDRQDTETRSGWPVTLVRSRAKGAAESERFQIHAFYVAVDRGCIGTAVAPELKELDAVQEQLLAADVDWQTDELVALVQLWNIDA